jgi:hypothetical protein
VLHDSVSVTRLAPMGCRVVLRKSMLVCNLTQETPVCVPHILILAVWYSSNASLQGTMVDCYCGCDTKANRMKFALSGALYLLGISALLLASLLSFVCLKRVDFGAFCL